MTLEDKAVRGVVWSAIENWVNHFLSLFVFLLLARLLNPESFGLIALASVFVALLQILAQQGFSQAIVQREQIESAHLDTAFWTNFGISVILASILYITAPWIANGFDQPILGDVLQWLSVGVIFNGLIGVHQGLLLREFKFKALAIRTIISTSIGGIVGVSMALTDYGVWALVGQQLVGGFIGAIMLWFSSGWRPGVRVSKTHFQDLFAFSSHILGIQLLSIVNRRLDDFLIGAILGPVALGVYTVAKKIFTTMTQLLVQTLSKVALPTFSRMQNDTERLRNAYYSAVQSTSTICIPAFIGVLVLAPDLIPALFGQQWEQSAPITQFLMIVGAVYTIGLFDGAVLLAVGKQRWAFYLHIANTLGNVIAFVIAVRWGIVAVAVAFSIRALVMFPVGNYLVRCLIQIRYREIIYRIRGPLLATLALVLLFFLIGKTAVDFSQWALITIKIISGIIIYPLMLYIFDRNIVLKTFELLDTAFKRSK